MNRKSFIGSLFAIGGLGIASYYGIKGYKTNVDITHIKLKKEVINQLAEILIPETETPGAISANVADFIINYLPHYPDKKSIRNLLEGIEELEQGAIELYKKEFVKLPEENKLVVFNEHCYNGLQLTGTAAKIKNKIFGKSFYSILKELVCIGYFTSMAGATKGLDYEMIPGKFIANYKIDPSKKGWATK
jgi:hypothetical protein